MSLSAATSASIPLTCLVCSRRNDFSDLSHLLTHISSKGHLANYFKMKLQAPHDAGIQQIIDTYDAWEVEHGLRAMVSQRMTQKDIKKEAAGGTTVRRATTPGPALASVRGTPAISKSTRKPSRLRGSTLPQLDPNLTVTTRKSQRLSPRADTPLNSFSPDLDNIRGYYNNFPPMHNWAQAGSQSPIKQEDLSSDYSDASFEIAPRPTTRRRRTQAHSLSGSNASAYDENINEEMANDLSKLKGVYWPGMSLFDSATTDMKRRRNQKKDDSVLQLLQATSEDTEATEMVFRDGRLKVERTITGNPESDDALISGESEPEPDTNEKKTTRRRARAPLANKNPNNGRLLRNKRHRSVAQNSPYARSRQGSYADQDEEDDDLTFRPRKTRQGLSIHNDHSGPGITFEQPQVPMNMLSSGFNDQARSNNNSRRSTPAQSHFIQSNPMHADTYAPRTHSRLDSNSWGQMTGQPSVGFRPMAFSGTIVNNGPTSSTGFSQFNDHAMAAPQTRSFLQYPGHSQNPFATNDNPLFMPPTNAGDTTLWDDGILDFAAEYGMPGMHPGTGEMSNPLFLGNKSDDDATISAGESDR